MRSQYADYFNHDEDAEEYDLDVTREDNPIRTGYASLLTCVGSRILPTATVLDLGSGTGNTIRALPRGCVVTAVDVSAKMSEISKAKLGDRTVNYVIGDLLDYVETTPLDEFDSIVSTYALHHLAPVERERLFTRIRDAAGVHTHVVIGDLMYKNTADRDRIVERFAPIFPELAEAVEEEFFWDIERTTKMLERLGWNPYWRTFSDLSWAVELV